MLYNIGSQRAVCDQKVKYLETEEKLCEKNIVSKVTRQSHDGW
jgi:hypothetical protein